MAEQVEVLFGGRTHVGSENRVLDGGTDLPKGWAPLKMICNDFLVVTVNCPQYVFNISKSI